MLYRLRLVIGIGDLLVWVLGCCLGFLVSSMLVLFIGVCVRLRGLCSRACCLIVRGIRFLGSILGSIVEDCILMAFLSYLIKQMLLNLFYEPQVS
jgi:hypothetical protein